MNFEHMPELGSVWGYPAVLLVIAVVCLALFLKFRRRGCPPVWCPCRSETVRKRPAGQLVKTIQSSEIVPCSPPTSHI
jgi:CorA-like Mg2+ transporter protein